MSQLCVPKCIRDKVLKLAHDSIFGGHMGDRKTRERIKPSFYWPRLKPDVRDYAVSCEACQLRSRKRTLDREPIPPITHDEIRFRRCLWIAYDLSIHRLHRDIIIVCVSLIVVLDGQRCIC